MSNVIDYQAQFEAYLLTERRVSENTFGAYSRDVRQLCQYLNDRRIGVEKCAKENLRAFLKILKDQEI